MDGAQVDISSPLMYLALPPFSSSMLDATRNAGAKFWPPGTRGAIIGREYSAKIGEQRPSAPVGSADKLDPIRSRLRSPLRLSNVRNVLEVTSSESLWHLAALTAPRDAISSRRRAHREHREDSFGEQRGKGETEVTGEGPLTSHGPHAFEPLARTRRRWNVRGVDA